MHRNTKWLSPPALRTTIASSRTELTGFTGCQTDLFTSDLSTGFSLSAIVSGITTSTAPASDFFGNTAFFQTQRPFWTLGVCLAELQRLTGKAWSTQRFFAKKLALIPPRTAFVGTSASWQTEIALRCRGASFLTAIAICVTSAGTTGNSGGFDPAFTLSTIATTADRATLRILSTLLDRIHGTNSVAVVGIERTCDRPHVPVHCKTSWPS